MSDMTEDWKSLTYAVRLKVVGKDSCNVIISDWNVKECGTWTNEGIQEWWYGEYEDVMNVGEDVVKRFPTFSVPFKTVGIPEKEVKQLCEDHELYRAELYFVYADSEDQLRSKFGVYTSSYAEGGWYLQCHDLNLENVDTEFEFWSIVEDIRGGDGQVTLPQDLEDGLNEHLKNTTSIRLS